MSDHGGFADILSRQRTQQARLREQQPEKPITGRKVAFVQALIALRCCDGSTWPPGISFPVKLAGRFTEVVRLLREGGELEGLLGWVSRPTATAREEERDVRAFAAQLVRLAADNEHDEIARRLGEADGLPFFGRLADWLRVGLWEAFAEECPHPADEDGVQWPVLKRDEPDPLSVVSQSCACLEQAFRRSEAGGPAGPSPQRVTGILKGLVIRAAQRINHPIPDLSREPRSVPEALQFVSMIRDWCAEQQDQLNDPRIKLRAAIQLRRGIYALARNRSAMEFDWQAGVDELWRHWRDLFPQVAPPERPAPCETYQQASDAVDSLLRALENLDAGATSIPGSDQRPRLSEVLATISGGKQRQLLDLLKNGDSVSIDRLLTTLYGNKGDHREALERLKTRTNETLTTRHSDLNVEIKKEGTTYRLAPV